MARTVTPRKSKMNPGWGILAAIIVAVGIFFVVQGFVVQLGISSQSTDAWNIMNWTADSFGWVFAYYFVGIVLIGIGKMIKWKAFASHWKE